MCNSYLNYSLIVIYISDIYSIVSISDSLALSFGLVSSVLGIIAVVVTRRNHVARSKYNMVHCMRTYKESP